MKEIKTVDVRVKGEEGKVKIEDSVYEWLQKDKQTFVRVGKNLIAGIVVNIPRLERINLWKETDGIYRVLGSMDFLILEGESVIWDLQTFGVVNKPDSLFVQQHKRHIGGAVRSHVKVLSRVQ